jgi:hypothetical protein
MGTIEISPNRLRMILGASLVSLEQAAPRARRLLRARPS